MHQENSSAFLFSVLSPALEGCINLYNLSGKQSIAVIPQKREGSRGSEGGVSCLVLDIQKLRV